MSGIVEQFGTIAICVAVVGVIVIIVTGNLLPLLVIGGVIWAIFCVALGLAKGGK